MRKHIYTPEEDEYIRTHYPDGSTREIAEKLGLSISSIYNRVSVLGVRKGREAYLEGLRATLKANAHKNKGCFKKGRIPANKGKKVSPEVYAKMERTMFKKGHLPHNTREDGAERITAYSQGKQYVMVRVALGDWQPKHVVEWEKTNGPLPKGAILHCLDGNTLNTDPSNWEINTRAESMRRCQMSDESIAMQIARSSTLTREEIQEHCPELIELKRMSYLLKKQINGNSSAKTE